MSNIRKHQTYYDELTEEYIEVLDVDDLDCKTYTYTEEDGLVADENFNTSHSKKYLQELELVDWVDYNFKLKSYPGNYEIGIIPTNDELESDSIFYDFTSDMASYYENIQEVEDAILNDITDLVKEKIGGELTDEEKQKLDNIASSIAFNFVDMF